MSVKRCISLLLLAVMVVSLLAVPVWATSWENYFPITVSDNSSTTRTYYPIVLERGGQSLVSGGYITANGTDTRMIRASSEKNYMMSTDNIAFVLDSLPAGGQQTHNLYTGYSPKVSLFPIIVGDGGYITVADNTTLELSDNFTIEQSGWIDASGGNSTWISPTSSSDPSDWTDEANAYDDNTATYADTYVGAGVWSGYLVLNVTGIGSDRVRYYAGRESANLDQIGIEIYYNGGWNVLYQGAPVLDSWETLTFSRELVSAARVRFHCITPATHGYLYEFDFGTSGGSLVSKVDAIDIYALSGNITAQILGTSANVTATSVASGEHTVRIESANYTWVNPTGFVDDPVWTLETSAYDDDTGTGASAGTINAGTYTPFLELTIDEVVTDIIRFYANRFGGIYNETIDVDAYYNATWNDVYEGTYTDETWEEKSLGDYYSVTAARIRFHVDSTGAFGSIFREFDFRAGGAQLYIDDVFQDGADWVTVPDTSADWIFMQNNVMSYANSITIDVGGVQQLWFEPNVMLAGTALPDRADTVANDGTITWGVNDQVTITYGAMTSYESTTSSASVNETGFQIPVVGIPTNWWGMNFDGTGLPFHDTFVDVSTQTGIPEQTLYVWLLFGVGVALATVTIMFTKSVIVGVAFFAIVMSYGANASIIAWWVVFTYLVMVAGIIFLSNRSALGG